MNRLVLRAIAVVDLAAGIFLVLTTWDRLYHEFGVSAPEQAVFAQAAGAFVIAMAYLLWTAPTSELLTRAVSTASALAHGLVALLCSVWLVVDQVPGHQAATLVSVGAACGLLALLSVLAALRGAPQRSPR